MQIIFIFFKKTIKRSILLLLFFFVATNVFSADIDFRKISSDPTWISLIHIYKSSPDIADKKFYIKNKFINLESELSDTYEEIFIKKNKDYLCRFPARYYFIKQKMNLPELDLNSCLAFKEFINKAPMDKISLVFASENVSMPTSMMGHVFLKISGENQQKIHVDHAISFFTDVDHENFVSLFFKSLITGMDGIYAMAPYEDPKNNYLYNEQRNLWEYELNLNEYQRNLLKYHLYELKNIKFKYFFHVFNCATVMNNVLSIAYPEIKEDRSNWVTPLDIVRSIYQRQFIASTTIIPSNTWKIMSIQESNDIDKDIIQNIKQKKYDQIVDQKRSTNKNYIGLELAKSCNDYNLEFNRISKNEWDKSDDFIRDEKKRILPDGFIDLAKYKSPQKTIQDSQYSLIAEKLKNKHIYKFNFLPVSHQLEDNNTEYSNESALKLGELELTYSPENKNIYWNKIVIYSATIIRPSDPILKGYSGRFEAGILEKTDENLNFSRYTSFEGAIGKSFRLSRDIDNYYFLNTNLRLNHKVTLAIGPEMGLIIREIFNMKSIVSLRRDYIKNDSYNYYNNLEILHSIYLNNFSINIKWDHLSNKFKSENNYSIGLKQFF